MAIVSTETFSSFCDAFRDMDRQENFSYKGKQALFNYLDELSEDIGDIQLDVIALCCEYTEYSDIDEYIREYWTVEQAEEIADLDDDDRAEAVEEYLNGDTSVVCFTDDCILFAAY